MLRGLFLFEALPGEHLESLAANSALVDYDAGLLFGEGEPARFFYVLVDGELSLSKRAGDRDVETTRTSHRGAYCGATASFIENPPEAYGFSARTVGSTRMIRIGAEYLGRFIRTHYPMAVHLLQGMHVDHEGVHQIVDQQRRIQAAGTLTAGLMHGLNNPAAAIARIASHLNTIHHRDLQVSTYGRLSPAAAAVYATFRSDASRAVQAEQISPASALERIQREERIDEWLTAHGIEQSWVKAPTLAAGGISVSWLQVVADTLDCTDSLSELDAVLSAVADRLDTLLLVKELAAASAEVSALVASARTYSQVDSSPLRQCELNELLDSTLTVMASVVGDGIDIRRDYAANLPPLRCYAAELNQAYNNIIQNAVEAIKATDERTGTITVRTSLFDPGIVRVDIIDTGAGIDAAIHDRIFLPFFTTKPVGQGIGMGLDLAWRTIVGMHRGSLSVASQPGNTQITACLPLELGSPEPHPAAP
ncbi:histidine kinase (plasmid) [Mycolicibacterium arabiense]|uniref:histidine kinase n=1 Tax=Mycolicibacterium arabiense TaxID=1286181 RepID=A0A7I7RQL8_9MYCO|nr:histidine kinase [Mycolicibacterium arabiense]